MQPITAKLSAVNGRGWEAELEGGNMVRGMGGLMLCMQGVIHIFIMHGISVMEYRFKSNS